MDLERVETVGVYDGVRLGCLRWIRIRDVGTRLAVVTEVTDEAEVVELDAGEVL